MALTRTTVPLDRYVVIDVYVQNASSIIIAPDADKIKDIKMKDFVVVAVGPACKRGLKEGDFLVVADGFHGVPLNDDLPPDNAHMGRFICNETDIIGKISFGSVE